MTKAVGLRDKNCRCPFESVVGFVWAEVVSCKAVDGSWIESLMLYGVVLSVVRLSGVLLCALFLLV